MSKTQEWTIGIVVAVAAVWFIFIRRDPLTGRTVYETTTGARPTTAAKPTTSSTASDAATIGGAVMSALGKLGQMFSGGGGGKSSGGSLGGGGSGGGGSGFGGGGGFGGSSDGLTPDAMWEQDRPYIESEIKAAEAEGSLYLEEAIGVKHVDLVASAREASDSLADPTADTGTGESSEFWGTDLSGFGDSGAATTPDEEFMSGFGGGGGSSDTGSLLEITPEAAGSYDWGSTPDLSDVGETGFGEATSSWLGFDPWSGDTFADEGATLASAEDTVGISDYWDTGTDWNTDDSGGWDTGYEDVSYDESGWDTGYDDTGWYA